MGISPRSRNPWDCVQPAVSFGARVPRFQGHSNELKPFRASEVQSKCIASVYREQLSRREQLLRASGGSYWALDIFDGCMGCSCAIRDFGPSISIAAIRSQSLSSEVTAQTNP